MRIVYKICPDPEYHWEVSIITNRAASCHKPRIGISECLLGNPVRYDGLQKLDRFLHGTAGAHVEWVPVCPEVECGLPVPREAMELRGNPKNPELVTILTNRDLTRQMMFFSHRRVIELEMEDLAGFIFKCRSPSCGLDGIEVLGSDGVRHPSGTGLFASEFMVHFPLLPMVDEGRLQDPVLRNIFFESVFCLHRFRSSAGDLMELMEFHNTHRVQIMAHSRDIVREMEHLLSGSDVPAEELCSRYEILLLEALRVRSGPVEGGKTIEQKTQSRRRWW